MSREMTISGKKPKKNVNHGVNEKSGVDFIDEFILVVKLNLY